jgi:hypothetical protein
VEFAPVGVRPASPGTDALHAGDVLEAIRATLTEARALRARPPGSSAPARISPGAFVRMVDLRPARLASLDIWWRGRARDGRVEVTRRLSLDAPRRIGDGNWVMRADLRSPWRLRPVPMELLLWRHLGEWTKLWLEPRRRVRVGRRYFRSGHRVLDRLCDRLGRELPAAAGTP